MLIKKLLRGSGSESHYCAIKGHPLEAIASNDALGERMHSSHLGAMMFG